jgi:hypothetical protein
MPFDEALINAGAEGASLKQIPSIQAGVGGSSVDITTHDRCRSNVFIDVRMAVSHNRRNDIYGLE